jgi:hypothetical protein
MGRLHKPKNEQSKFFLAVEKRITHKGRYGRPPRLWRLMCRFERPTGSEDLQGQGDASQSAVTIENQKGKSTRAAKRVQGDKAGKRATHKHADKSTAC